MKRCSSNRSHAETEQNDMHLGAHHGQKQTSRNNSFEIENLLKTAEQITGFCRSPQETRKSSPTGSVTSSMVGLVPSRQLTDVEKLRKVILELVDTERTYVKHLKVEYPRFDHIAPNQLAHRKNLYPSS